VQGRYAECFYALKELCNGMQCPYFGKCGGCSLQHIPYDVQVKNKADHVQQYLIKAGVHVDLGVFSGQPFAYRNRMDFVFHESGIGLRAKEKWWKIIDVESCPIANQGVNHLLGEVRSSFQRKDVFDIRKQVGTLKYCLMRATRQGESALSFVMNEDSPRLSEQVEQVRQFALQSSAAHVLITYVPRKSEVSVGEEYFSVKGSRVLTEVIKGKKLKYAVQGFFQNNPDMAEAMVGYVDSLFSGGDLLVDVFGGVGLFGVSLGERFKEVIIVESFKESVQFAQENLKDNNVSGKAICLDAGQLAKLNLQNLQGEFDVVVDPPRTGIPDKAWAYLLTARPRTIVYVSCNPEQLSKELRRVIPQYTVSEGAIFDLFPQTNHVETVLKLVRT
jgi:23S rRNA (uracil-5-)-methyltransferase RumA